MHKLLINKCSGLKQMLSNKNSKTKRNLVKWIIFNYTKLIMQVNQNFNRINGVKRISLKILITQTIKFLKDRIYLLKIKYLAKEKI